MFKPTDLVALDHNKHGSLRLAAVTDYNFAAKSHAVPVAGSEFLHAAREYPIVFIRREDGSFMPTVMLGFRVDENLFLSPDSRWEAHYIPFFIRRYPFVAVDVENNTDAVVCLDETALPSLRSDTGMPLFTDGKPSQQLQDLINRLSEFRDEGLRVAQWSKLLADQNLFKEVSAKADLSNGESVTMEGMWVIDDSKLASLPAALVHEWVGNGLLALVYAHLLSLGNLQVLAAKLGARAANAPAAL